MIVIWRDIKSANDAYVFCWLVVSSSSRASWCRVITIHVVNRAWNIPFGMEYQVIKSH